MTTTTSVNRCAFPSLLTQSPSVLRRADAEAAVRVQVFDVKERGELFGCLGRSWDRRGQSVME